MSITLDVLPDISINMTNSTGKQVDCQYSENVPRVQLHEARFIVVTIRKPTCGNSNSG